MENNFIAIIAGIGTYNDIGMIRSLGEKHIPIFYITNEPHVFPIHKSKYITQTIYCDMSELEFINTIKSVCTQQKAYGVVFPTSDITALYLDRNYENLKEICTFSNAHGKLEYEMDKLIQVNRAIEAGLDVPSAISADAKNLPQGIKYPCIIKPLASIFGSKSDITVCKNESDLSIAKEKYINKDCSQILIQDFITDIKLEIGITGIALPNGEVIIKGMFHKQGIIGGSAVYGTYSIEEHAVLYDRIKKYIHLVDYVGIFDMDFLKDSQGKYHFIECNYRNGAYGYAVTAAGFNMPYILFKAITSQQWNEPNKLRSVVFMEERSYILNLLQKRISLWHWLKDVASTDVFLWFNWKDIKPYIRIPHFIKKFFVKK